MLSVIWPGMGTVLDSCNGEPLPEAVPAWGVKQRVCIQGNVTIKDDYGEKGSLLDLFQ